ncbi:hypothetical protein D8X55_04445 [Malacoplasma penetrans]|nr:MYPE2350 family membrane protein [Malacoplasma penetrans]RXY96215.1 hypothetical protein D8X55_04445 [Malacoplasma penetrans]
MDTDFKKTNSKEPVLEPIQNQAVYDNRNGYYNNHFNNPYMMNNQNSSASVDVLNTIKWIRKTSAKIVFFYIITVALLIVGLVTYLSMSATSKNFDNDFIDFNPISNIGLGIGIFLIGLSCVFYITIFILEILLILKLNNINGKHNEFKDVKLYKILLIIGLVIPVFSIIDCFLISSKCAKILGYSSSRRLM